MAGEDVAADGSPGDAFTRLSKLTTTPSTAGGRIGVAAPVGTEATAGPNPTTETVRTSPGWAGFSIGNQAAVRTGDHRQAGPRQTQVGRRIAGIQNVNPIRNRIQEQGVGGSAVVTDFQPREVLRNRGLGPPVRGALAVSSNGTCTVIMLTVSHNSGATIEHDCESRYRQDRDRLRIGRKRLPQQNGKSGQFGGQGSSSDTASAGAFPEPARKS